MLITPSPSIENFRYPNSYKNLIDYGAVCGGEILNEMGIHGSLNVLNECDP